MLPFTKRPGRGGEDGEVFTKDDLEEIADLAATAQKPASLAPPPASNRPRRPADSFSDDEVTNFIPSKSINAFINDARSKPASIPPPPASRRPPASIPPPPHSSRAGKFITGTDEDEDGRTVVRGAPKIVKKGASVPPGGMQPPTTTSPAAVIKATLESARAAKRANEGALMPPPPAELLEDVTDHYPADHIQRTLAMGGVGNAPASVRPPPSSQHPYAMQSPYTAPMGMQPVGVSELGATMLAGVQPISQPPPSSHGPLTGPPSPMYMQHPHHHHHHMPPPSGSIPPPPPSYGGAYPPASQSASVQGVAMSNSMPAHFMVPNAPYSDGRIDPPGTSVTARHRVSGRSASAWAMALVAAGLFVGVGAVAVMQSNDSLMDTTASFVDPARASAKTAAAAQPAADPAPQATPTTAVAPTVVVPPAAPVDPNAGAPVVQPPVAAAPVQPAAAPEPKPVAAATPAPPTPKAAWAAPAPRPPPPAVAAAPAAAPAPKAPAAPKVASNDDPPAEKPVKAGKAGKAGKGDATDDETKKALEALQKAQLESSFGDK